MCPFHFFSPQSPVSSTTSYIETLRAYLSWPKYNNEKAFSGGFCFCPLFFFPFCFPCSVCFSKKNFFIVENSFGLCERKERKRELINWSVLPHCFLSRVIHGRLACNEMSRKVKERERKQRERRKKKRRDTLSKKKRSSELARSDSH